MPTIPYWLSFTYKTTRSWEVSHWLIFSLMQKSGRHGFILSTKTLPRFSATRMNIFPLPGIPIAMPFCDLAWFGTSSYSFDTFLFVFAKSKNKQKTLSYLYGWFDENYFVLIENLYRD